MCDDDDEFTVISPICGEMIDAGGAVCPICGTPV